MQDQLIIKGARLHNLKNITVNIPKNRLVVLTGLSGSGKSTLAFDTLHKEGQRQFMESLGLVTHSLTKPPIDSITGLSPSISVDQHLSNRSPRSTVGTATEVFTYLRVLYARIGHRICSNCGAAAPPSFDIVANGAWEGESADVELGGDEEAGSAFPCPDCGAPIPEMGMAHFSFNKPAGACPTCTGLGVIHQANLDHLIDPERSILEGGVLTWERYHIENYPRVLKRAAQHYGFTFDPEVPIKKLGRVQQDLLLYGVGSQQIRQRFPDMDPPDTVREGHFEGIVTNLLRRYAEHAQEGSYREKIEKQLTRQVCPDCEGTRLRPASRQVRVDGLTIVDVSRLPLAELLGWIDRLQDVLSPEAWIIAEAIMVDLRERVRRLVDVGVGYLTLERSSPTLSAGEAQRLRLAALLGSGLTGVLYVLDEPTIGLHPRDNERLIQVLRELRDLGNTVLVIEHDLDMIRAADYVLDFGPGAGVHGGQVVATGSPESILSYKDSKTAAYLSGQKSVPVPDVRRSSIGKYLTIQGACEHNLKDITVKLPLGMFITITGVSGSGKSTLMFDILDRAARQRFYGASEAPGVHAAIDGWEFVDKIVTFDQTPIGRTPRSNAATYTDAFTPIRQAFANQTAAHQSGLTARHFSFNMPGGRCDRCEGAGVLTVEMHFLPDVQVRCPVCHGRRYKREVLEVKYRGVNIASVLRMTIEEALAVFQDVPAAKAKLSLMVDVGLGYLQLGQPATTFSGGEAQRVKLAKELARRTSGRTLYLLDEPTTGLHAEDVAHLLVVLQRLVDAGNTVAVIEHNLDVIKTADWIIDLGPEGGEAGGYIIAEGKPEQVAQVSESLTGSYLHWHL